MVDMSAFIDFTHAHAQIETENVKVKVIVRYRTLIYHRS